MENLNLSTQQEQSIDVQPAGRAVRIRSSQVEPLSKLLARAFYNHAAVTYVLPDQRIRRAVLPWFFTSVAIRAARLCGEVFTNVNLEGGALWIRPGGDLTLGRAAMTEVQSLPIRIDRRSISRWNNLIGHLESARRNLGNELHWYLMAIATDPSKISVRRDLMNPVLAEADWDHRHCYAETFDEKELSFYQKQGFQIIGAGQIPEGGPNFWTMIRPPRPAY